MVVLCQFHAITAVKKKMTEPKYEISSPDQVRIIVPESQAVIDVTKTEKLLSEMIKAKTKKPQKKK
ncbi:hypothetical protein PRIC2_013822 [Phytophthora ramorum]